MDQNALLGITNQDGFHKSDYCHHFSVGPGPREADSGVVTDSGCGPGVSSVSSLTTTSRLSVVSGSVSASVSLDNLYLGEEADSASDQSNR